jgi:hypothetical protein
MIIERTSQLTGVTHKKEINVTEKELEYYYNGNGCIQNIFPYLSADDREFIKTGITSEEWDNLFGEEDE